jgi:hypothetical protein
MLQLYTEEGFTPLLPTTKDTAIMITYNDLLNALQNVHEYSTYAAARCVFHQDSSPSLLVYKDGWFRCLGCSRTGSWLQLYNRIKGQATPVHPERRLHVHSPNHLFDEFQTVEHGCYQAHMDLLQFTSWQWYLEQRGLGDSTEIAEIGYLNGWYTIPVKDRDGNFITVVLRAAPHVQLISGHRYWCHHAPTMYVPDWRLLDRAKFIVVVFGIFDALTLNKLRYPVVTVTSGKNQFCAEWLDEYRRPIYIIPDKGEEETAHKLASHLGWRGNVVRLDFPDGCKDANDFLMQNKEADLRAQLTRIDR